MASRLDSLRIASPCHERWDDMVGDDEVRHCKACDKDVFDLSAVSRERAEAVLAAQVTPCVRLRRRSLMAGAIAAGAAMATAAPVRAEPPPVAADAQPTGALQGVVRDAATGEPMIGATVVVAGTTPGEIVEITDENGQYAFAALPPDTYAITVYFAESTQERRDVVVTAGAVAIANISMTLDCSGTIILDDSFVQGLPEPGRSFEDVLGAVAGTSELGVSFMGQATTTPPPPPPRRRRLGWSTWVRVGYGTGSDAPTGVARVIEPRSADRHAVWELALGADLTFALRDSLRVGAWTEVRTTSSPVLGVELVLVDEELLALRAGGNDDALTAALAYGSRRHRLVVSATRSLDDPRDWSATAGVELELLGALRSLLR